MWKWVVTGLCVLNAPAVAGLCEKVAVAEVAAKSFAVRVWEETVRLNRAEKDFEREERLTAIKAMEAPPGWIRVTDPQEQRELLKELHDRQFPNGELKWKEKSVVVVFSEEGAWKMAQGYAVMMSNFNPGSFDFNEHYTLRMHALDGWRKFESYNGTVFSPNYERCAFGLAENVPVFWIQTEGDYGLPTPAQIVHPSPSFP